MKIAQIAPLVESVPPTLYGGTERVVSWLTEELVALGHDVTLFASGDSVTKAKLEPIVPTSLRLTGIHDCSTYNIIMLDQVAARMSQCRGQLPGTAGDQDPPAHCAAFPLGGGLSQRVSGMCPNTLKWMPT